MISSTLGGVIVLAQAFLGMHGHGAPRPGCCDVCGIRRAAVLTEITRLRTCPKWRQRDDAAHALRRVDWHCHPEVVDALAYSLLRDCEEEVREEAAETLAKLAPCTPVAHQALRQAADCDPDHATRKWARRALKAMTRRCEAPCQACGPTPGGYVVSPQVDAPTDFPEPLLAPGEILVPQSGREIFPSPPMDSTIVPPADAPGWAPVPEALKEIRLLRPAVFTRRSRPNFAPFLLGPPPRSASGR